MEAVLDLEGLAHRPLLRARAHCARRDALGVPDVDGRAADVALEPLLPEVEVDRGDRGARYARVQERIGNVKQRALDVFDVVAVVADHARQARLAYFVELRLGEARERVGALVPEPVALTQVTELDSCNRKVIVLLF